MIALLLAALCVLVPAGFVFLAYYLHYVATQLARRIDYHAGSAPQITDADKADIAFRVTNELRR